MFRGSADVVDKPVGVEEDARLAGTLLGDRVSLVIVQCEAIEKQIHLRRRHFAGGQI